MNFKAIIEEDVIELTQLMNILAFGGSKGLMDTTSIKKFDANFISVYSAKEERFHYYVQRLCGLAIDNEVDPI